MVLAPARRARPRPASAQASQRTRREVAVGTAAAAAVGAADGPNRAKARGKAGKRRVRYEEVQLDVGAGVAVPMSVWLPDAEAATLPKSDVQYRHAISLAKVARLILRWDRDTPVPTWFDWPSIDLPAGDGVFTVGASAPLGEQASAVLLAHGFLGSRFDLVDYAEMLASRGIAAVAPDFRESLSSAAGADVPRDVVVKAALELVEERCGVPRGEVGIAGHSAGAGTTLLTPGVRPRVALAGFRGGCSEDVLASPLLVVASDNDGVISMGPTKPDAPFPFEGVQAAVDTLPDVTRFGESDLDALLQAEALPSPAFVRLERANHLSFLSARTNDALCDYLAPLLPVAETLDVRVLDFDKYVASGGDAYARTYLAPLVASFFAQHLSLA